MNQIIPSEKYSGIPCSLVALGCMADYYGLKKDYRAVIRDNNIKYKDDGYLTLDGFNKLLRASWGKACVTKSVYFKQNERIKLKDFPYYTKKLHKEKGLISPIACITVLGHSVFAVDNSYYSFFDNNDDEIVRIWYISDPYMMTMKN